MMPFQVMNAQMKSKAPAWVIKQQVDPQAFVLTLCGSSSSDSHTLESQVQAARQLIENKGHSIVLDRCIAKGVAYDLEFNAFSLTAWHIFKTLTSQLSGVDIAVQPVSQRIRKLLICDMDKTIVDAETLDEVAEVVGIGQQVAAITAQAMRGEIDFETSLKQRVALLKGQPELAFIDMANACRVNPGAEQLVLKARQAGIYTVLISGGFDTIARPVAQRLGFDEVHSNRLEVHNGILTGGVLAPIVDANSKRELLLSIAAKLGIDPVECCAIGDGANDIPMITLAGLGVAYQGKPATREATPYQINKTSLTTGLYFMGLQSE
ncbi:MAG: phosphoserine phosphatase [Gammaproteobacteria bacterium]|jgi:phosphoserine phosphatase